MATLTGKTIGELNILTGITNNTLFPVEQNLITYQVTYETLVNGITGGTSLYETGLGTCSTQRVGVSGCAIGDYSIVAGGYQNTSSDNYSTVSGGRCNTTDSDYGHNIIGGGRNNTISSY